MGAPVKRKREQDEAPAASTSTQATTKKVVVDVAWPSIHSGIQGTRGEPGAVEGEFCPIKAILQICLWPLQRSLQEGVESIILTVMPCV